MKYDVKRIAWELQRTANGDDYYGNALYVAYDMPQASKEDREMLHRYMCGSNLTTDYFRLQDFAIRLTSHGTMCDAAEVADLEAKCAELGGKCAELEALNAEMLDIIESLHYCSEYWSGYDVPIGIVERMGKVIAHAKGDKHEQP